MQKVVIIRKENIKYPGKDDLFRPSYRYPENPFPASLSNRTNNVYDMVRSAFIRYGLDKENVNTNNWNPLKEYVFPGDKVLIKPNLVMDTNYNIYGGTECLYTHPSVVAPIIDYVIIALKGNGEIIVGDAPLQECTFDNLITTSGYLDLINFYKSKGIAISLMDFRNTKTVIIDKVHYEQENNKGINNGIVVRIDEDSAFAGLSEDRLKRLRVTNYDPRILQEHHRIDRHEYLIANQVLEADVIINVPKPKTHRKAGITAALKNLVGINACKEYLPHHTNGSLDEGGDCYRFRNEDLQKANDFLDKKNILISDHNYEEAREAINQHDVVLKEGMEKTGERYWEGRWYGNDTIWRTIADLNRILFYSDKHGNMAKTCQRKYFAIGDMIVSGHREGPLNPSPINANSIVVGEDPLAFDRAVCAIMGFDYHKVPSLNGEYITDGKFAIAKNSEPIISSNYPDWDRKKPSEITVDESIKFIPSRGWECRLGNPLKEDLLKQIKEIGKPIIIYGAGKFGKQIGSFLNDEEIEVDVICFFDSDPDKWGKKVIGNIECVKPYDVEEKYVCVISAREQIVSDILNSAKQFGFSSIFCYPI